MEGLGSALAVVVGRALIPLALNTLPGPFRNLWGISIDFIQALPVGLNRLDCLLTERSIGEICVPVLAISLKCVQVLCGRSVLSRELIEIEKCYETAKHRNKQTEDDGQAACKGLELSAGFQEGLGVS